MEETLIDSHIKWRMSRSVPYILQRVVTVYTNAPWLESAKRAMLVYQSVLAGGIQSGNYGRTWTLPRWAHWLISTYQRQKG
jgi:hypothetical protein